MQTKPKLAIFDFDGTLADTRPFMLSILDHLAERFNTRRVNIHSLEQMRGYTARQLMELYGVPMWKFILMARESQKLLYQNITSIQLFPGVESALRAIARQNVAIAVVTSNQLRNVLAVLGEELAGLVSVFECEAGFFTKARKLRSALRQAGVKPGEAVSFGDESRDIEAARKVGIPCAAVTWGYAHSEVLRHHQPDYLLTSVDQITGIVAE
jgi:phosphoglycolate phosphatase